MMTSIVAAIFFCPGQTQGRKQDVERMNILNKQASFPALAVDIRAAKGCKPCPDSFRGKSGKEAVQARKGREAEAGR